MENPNEPKKKKEVRFIYEPLGQILLGGGRISRKIIESRGRRPRLSIKEEKKRSRP
jgi:hypothetical protein